MINHLIFVYGTLKRNQYASHMMKDAVYYGTAITSPEYALYTCGAFPAMIERLPGRFVEGELYGVSNGTKENLDIYEGVRFGHYQLKKVRLHKITLESFEKLPNLPVKSYLYQYNTENLKEIATWC